MFKKISDRLTAASPKILSVLCCYPIASTLLMTLVWQIAQYYHLPFFGGYYFEWIYLYTADYPELFSGAMRSQSQILYSVYLICIIAVITLTVLAIRKKHLRAQFSWGLCAFWTADLGWLLYEMSFNDIEWQHWALFFEHLLFIVLTVCASILYLRLKSTDPVRFQPRAKKRSKKSKRRYTSRFD